MIVVITGANGFIGRHLCAAFAARGDDVRRVLRADFRAGRLEELTRGADVVVHAAGATRAPSSNKLRASNVDLTARVIEAASAGAGRLVFISSQAAAGPASALDRPVREDDPATPIEAYGESKRDAELLVRQSGQLWTILRPSAVYGPGDRDFRAMFALARRGLAIHAGNRSQWISIVHVQDCVGAIVAAATAEAAMGRTYFIANDEPVQWKTLFDLTIAAASSRTHVDLEVPMPVVRLGAFVGDLAARLTGSAGLLTSEKLALAKPPFFICSNARAKHELGFVPRVALGDGLADTYRWYLENGGF